MTVKCVSFGKFVSYSDMDEAKLRFEPLNEFGPEVVEWTCSRCVVGDSLQHQPTELLHGRSNPAEVAS
jgi:hypothetical protein